MDLEKEVESLKKLITELEKSILKDSEHFGRLYSTIGSSNSDTLIKTRGQIKILWGNKFIDLLDENGKLKVDSKIIYKQSVVGNKDGIYVLDSGDVILLVGGKEIKLINEGFSYVSFQENQQSTSELKYSALQNIGFLHKSISELNETSLLNGIIYSEKEQKLYIIINGKFEDYLVENFNNYTGQIIIKKDNNLEGAIIIKGEGINNSLKFDGINIYSNNDSLEITNEDLDLLFSISNLSVYCSVPIICNSITSKDFSEDSGFNLYSDESESVLIVDKVITRDPIVPVGTLVEYYGDINLLSDDWFVCSNIDSEVTINGFTIPLNIKTPNRQIKYNESSGNGVYILKIK